MSILANATIFTKTVSKTNQMLLLLIKMIGGVDIVLLAAYVAMCIYDRPGREKQWIFFRKETVQCMKMFHFLYSIIIEFFIASLLKSANI